jgi:hypothetical protein
VKQKVVYAGMVVGVYTDANDNGRGFSWNSKTNTYATIAVPTMAVTSPWGI